MCLTSYNMCNPSASFCVSPSARHRFLAVSSNPKPTSPEAFVQRYKTFRANMSRCLCDQRLLDLFVGIVRRHLPGRVLQFTPSTPKMPVFGCRVENEGCLVFNLKQTVLDSLCRCAMYYRKQKW